MSPQPLQHLFMRFFIIAKDTDDRHIMFKYDLPVTYRWRKIVPCNSCKSLQISLKTDFFFAAIYHITFSRESAG